MIHGGLIACLVYRRKTETIAAVARTRDAMAVQYPILARLRACAWVFPEMNQHLSQRLALLEPSPGVVAPRRTLASVWRDQSAQRACQLAGFPRLCLQPAQISWRAWPKSGANSSTYMPLSAALLLKRCCAISPSSTRSSRKCQAARQPADTRCANSSLFRPWGLSTPRCWAEGVPSLLAAQPPRLPSTHSRAGPRYNVKPVPAS
jgi:hypothetical protein